MRAGRSFHLKSQGATPLLIAALVFAFMTGLGAPTQALDDALEAPTDIEDPAEALPGIEAPSEDDLAAPDELDPDGLMRPDIKEGGEDAPPPHSAEESKQDKLDRSTDNLPLPTPLERPKMLGQLYEQLPKARDAQAAAPIIEAIEDLWRLSGSPTVDLLMSRAERLAKEQDLDLALKIIDATVDIAPDEAEAWHLRAKVHYLRKDYELAIADLRRALDRDPLHYGANNDLGVALEAIGAKKEALQAYRKAIAVNPFLGETKRAVEELRREVEGQDI
jgi:tetratricopeptide (TPR) repeat protein